MKITFIGTSHGIPEIGRKTTSTMLECGESVYFIDGGCSPADAMIDRGISFKQLRAVFTTHAHGDHTGGLLSLIDLMNWCYTSSRCEFYLTSEKLPEAIEIFAAATGNALAKDRVKLLKAYEGKVYEDENIAVEYLKTRHMEAPGQASYAILVTEKQSGKRVLFSGDVSRNLALDDYPVRPLYEGVDIFVTEMAHIRVPHIAPYIEKAKIGRLYVNHYVGESFYKELKEDLKSLGEKCNIETVLTLDGTVAEL